MARYEIEISRTAERQLRKLPRTDQERSPNRENAPVYAFVRGGAYPPRFEVATPRTARPSTIFTAAVTPSTTGTPSSSESERAMSTMPAQPSTMDSQPSSSMCATDFRAEPVPCAGIRILQREHRDLGRPHPAAQLRVAVAPRQMLQGRHRPAQRRDHREAAGDDRRHLHRRLADADHRGGGHASRRVDSGVVEAPDDHAGGLGVRLHRVEHRGNREDLVVVPLDALRPVLGGDGDDFGSGRRHRTSRVTHLVGHGDRGVGVDEEQLHLADGPPMARMMEAAIGRGSSPVRAESGRGRPRAYTIPLPASVPCLRRRRLRSVMKNRLSMMTRNETPVVTVPSA